MACLNGVAGLVPHPYPLTFDVLGEQFQADSTWVPRGARARALRCAGVHATGQSTTLSLTAPLISLLQRKSSMRHSGRCASPSAVASKTTLFTKGSRQLSGLVIEALRQSAVDPSYSSS